MRTATLRAGLETAEWAYGRPDVRAAVVHAQAPVALETRLVGAVSGAFSVYEYLAAVDLDGLDAVESVSARSLLPGVAAYVQGLSLAPAPEDARYRLESGAAVNAAARPRASLAGGAVTWTLDQPERIGLRTSAAGAGTLVLADSDYPGWTATVDGVAAAVRPVEGLFRGVDLAPGAHEVVFVYRPLSLLVGALCTLLGLVIAGITVALPRLHRGGPLSRGGSGAGTTSSPAAAWRPVAGGAAAPPAPIQAAARAAPPPAVRAASSHGPASARGVEQVEVEPALAVQQPHPQQADVGGDPGEEGHPGRLQVGHAQGPVVLPDRG